MSSYLHAITNLSSSHVHLTVLRDSDTKSYDVVLGPNHSLDYGFEGAQIPEANNQKQFVSKRATVDVGQSRYSLFVLNSRLRIVKGDMFSLDAPELPGFGSSSAFGLRILANGGLEGFIYRFIEQPFMTSVPWVAGRYGIYGISASGALLEKAFMTKHWNPWASLGRPRAGLIGPAAGVSWVKGRYSVYALSADGTIYERFWKTVGWEEWIQHEPPKGAAIINLSAVSWTTNRYGLYAVTNNGHLFQKWWAPSSWSEWEDLGQPATTRLSGPITAVCWSSNRYGIYALGADGSVWQKWWAPSSWSKWEELEKPPVPLKSLTSASWADRVYAVGGVGEDGQLWELVYSRRWESWKGRRSPRRLSGAVTAICWFWLASSSGKYAYYALDEEGTIWQLWKDEWTPLDGR